MHTIFIKPVKNASIRSIGKNALVLENWENEIIKI